MLAKEMTKPTDWLPAHLLLRDEVGALAVARVVWEVIREGLGPLPHGVARQSIRQLNSERGDGGGVTRQPLKQLHAVWWHCYHIPLPTKNPKIKTNLYDVWLNITFFMTDHHIHLNVKVIASGITTTVGALHQCEDGLTNSQLSNFVFNWLMAIVGVRP